MQKVTKNPDSYRDKAAAIAPRAQPGQRTGNSLAGLGGLYVGGLLIEVSLIVLRALEEGFWRKGWAEAGGAVFRLAIIWIVRDWRQGGIRRWKRG